VLIAGSADPSDRLAFDMPMLAGSSPGSGGCTDFSNVVNGNVERAYGKVNKNQVTMAMMTAPAIFRIAWLLEGVSS